MRIAVFSAKLYDRSFLAAANGRFGHDLVFMEPCLELATSRLAEGFVGVCVFVNDLVDRAVLEALHGYGVTLVALRCAGFNNIDLRAADALGITVVRVPAYSPNAVAEFTIGLLLTLERKIHRAWARVRDDNFALDGLIGRNVHGRVAGVIGTGRIGALVARTLRLGLGCEVLASDPIVNSELAAIGVQYVDMQTLLKRSDIVSLHCPLTPGTHHLINAASLDRARTGLTIINTSRGALIDTEALIDGLKSGHVGAVALDVYEQEADLFFADLSDEIVQDDVFQRLLTFPNVLVTGHQAFLTEESLAAIAETTLANIADFEAGRPLANQLLPTQVLPAGNVIA